MDRRTALLSLFVFAGFLPLGFAEDASAPELSEWALGAAVANGPVPPESLRGKVVALVFWGVRSGPSVAAMPPLVQLDRELRSRDLVIVAAEVQEAADEEVLRVVEGQEISFPVVRGAEGPVVGGTGLPKAHVFDAAGKLVYTGHPLGDDFRRAVDGAVRSRKRDAASAGGAERRSAAAPAERVWTTTAGEEVLASLFAVQEDRVKLRLPGGRIVTYRIAELSERDRRRLGE